MKIQGKVLLALGSCIWALPAMAQDTLFAERDGSRFIVTHNFTRAQAAAVADCDETWPEGHDAVIAGADGEFYLADDWEPWA